jgi:hypothetical protein
VKLNDPYPYTYSVKGNIAIILLISLFVAGFLVVFEPFGLHNAEIEKKVLLLSGYGLVNLVILSLNLLLLPIILPGLFSEKRWTVLYQLLFLMWIVFSIGLGNYSYTRIVFGYPDTGVKGILLFQFYTLVIAVFPVLLITITNYNRLLKRNMAEALEMATSIEHQKEDTKPEKVFTIQSSNKNETLSLNINHFLFAASEGNYVKVMWSDDNELQYKLIRTTLTRVSENLERDFPPLFRVHRSYIVNTDKVKRISGNAQGLLLYFEDTEVTVPVSRSFVPELRKVLNT